MVKKLRVGIIGDPVVHSISPAMQQPALDELGIPAIYERWPTTVVPVMHGFVLMLPILIGDLVLPHDHSFASSIWVTAFAIELVLYAVGTVLSFS